jgi:hypothetical protein
VFALLALTCVAVAFGRSTPGARAVGEGVFQLDKTAYTVAEGTAFPVTVQRTDGSVLTQDVQVIITVDGVTEFDIPSAEATKLVTFPKGTNLTSQTILIQTLNKEQFTDRGIQITILSVSNGGTIGARHTAPVTIQGFGTPRIFDVSPDSGGSFPTEGTIITLTGEHFVVTGATITSTVADVEFWLPFSGAPEAVVIPPTDVEVLSSTLLRVRVPALGADYAATLNQPLSTYDVRVKVTKSDATEAISPINENDKYVHTTGPTITALSVRQGPPVGGTQVIINGTKFFGTANTPCLMPFPVTFGGIAVTSCKYLSADSVLVTTPAHVSGLVDAVYNNGAPSPAVPDSHYSYTGIPVITNLQPSFGPQTGGTSVLISGSNFFVGGQGPSAVLFGGNAASWTLLDDNHIRAVSPPGSGVQQVKIIHPVSGSSEFHTEANFTYTTGPVVESINPGHGPSSGGTIVTINGIGFALGATVKFGDQQAFSTFVSTNQMTATAPPGVGTVNITVTVNGTQSPVGPSNQWSYDGPQVLSVTPNAGPPAGGTQIIIKGANFTSASVVEIAGKTVVPVFVDPQTLTATTPAAGPIAAHVHVITGSGTSPDTPADLFTYTNGPIIDSVNPNTGPTLGGTIVVITGKNFTSPLSISFGGLAATSFNVNSATQITVLSPPNGTAGPADVRVTKGPDVSPVGPQAKFTYVSATPKITSLTPNSGSTFGGTEVTIAGLGFSGATCPGAVKFGTLDATSCSVVNDTTITTVAPANLAGPTVVTVTTANGTSDIVPNYTYISPTGTGGGSTSPPPPGPGGTIEYVLSARWTLLTWTGVNGASVADAIRGSGITGATDLTGRISAIYLWDASTSTFKAYFTGAEAVPGANDFAQFSIGSVYWVAILGTGQVQWLVKAP